MCAAGFLYVSGFGSIGALERLLELVDDALSDRGAEIR